MLLRVASPKLRTTPIDPLTLRFTNTILAVSKNNKQATARDASCKEEGTAPARDNSCKEETR
jgi:hypothetical protein